MKQIPVIAFILLSSFSVVAQTAVAPPPRPGTAQPSDPAPAPQAAALPSATGPSLETTLKFIADKMNEHNKVNFVLYLHNTTNDANASTVIQRETSQVVADSNQCTLSFRRSTTDSLRHKKLWHVDFSIPLRDVRQIEVKSWEEAECEMYVRDGTPNIKGVSTDPHTIAVAIRRPHNSADYLIFPDNGVADRVARALLHAVELCGGGVPQEAF